METSSQMNKMIETNKLFLKGSRGYIQKINYITKFKENCYKNKNGSQIHQEQNQTWQKWI